ncbi:N-acetylglucosaminyldiphosphoundecaprenol N-acetyl-beta-D-mannosaminyltransferase [Austwickia sp. TVS 96-490-7B]|uniref:WecB/TagA/CpsF family glycosyltransferase n=1 Tax=Austwickia sp. TVS 96-490-7B TaxID=2830843 RepID=UPI001C572542|nr:WecB/TagA/CpsF family glycosyltransferase [Austwickia sp. TVS 96-490-7B]MBW3084585.1 N-acetylglucosaminyldiphosphoundecaprenol N-acetyl-beta-D-mannosaminyltransferase [Austwickia sp. TVS 96-490-7B]
MDRAVAGLTLALLFPVLLVRAVIAYLSTGQVFESEDLFGRSGAPFTVRTFADGGLCSRLPHLVAVCCGHLRFVGPRPLTSDEIGRLSSRERWRLKVTPGMFSLHRLRAATGIAYDPEHHLDQEHVQEQHLLTKKNLGIVLRSLLVHGVSTDPQQERPGEFSLLGVHISNFTMSQALDWIQEQVRTATTARLICFVNPACLNTAVEDQQYRDVLDGSDLILPDGIGIKIASQIHGFTVQENVNGTDLFPRLCRRAVAEGISLYLLGARPGVAAQAAEEMRRRFPELLIAGTRSGYFAPEEEPQVIEEINASGAEILLVAMGAPRQELWLARVLPSLQVRVAMGVGGLFDFYSGRIPRAPLWVREIGMEWVWRLGQEPQRMWRRYLVGNPLFLYRVWQDRAPTTGKGHPSETEQVNADALVPDVTVSLPPTDMSPHHWELPDRPVADPSRPIRRRDVRPGQVAHHGAARRVGR